MKKLLPLLALLTTVTSPSLWAAEEPVAIAIHGGAGTIEKSRMTPEREKAYRAKLKEALDTGYGILDKGGSSMDAVVAAITVLEQLPLFNAGKGGRTKTIGRP